MVDRGDPDARERALAVARRDPSADVSPEKAVTAIDDVLGSIGNTCPECAPGGMRVLTGKDSLRRLHAACQRRFDRPHVPPAVQRFPGKKYYSALRARKP